MDALVTNDTTAAVVPRMLPQTQEMLTNASLTPLMAQVLATGKAPGTPDPIEHPLHYTAHPSGIECIQVTEHMGFNLGNAIKYVWRCDLKQDAIEDLKKAAWYIQREIDKRTKK